jgi:hypothetical protein
VTTRVLFVVSARTGRAQVTDPARRSAESDVAQPHKARRRAFAAEGDSSALSEK